jgi:hypothetical protein
MMPSDLPILQFPEVVHVGTMDPARKQPGSYEGRCLSVSVVPSAWAQIARLGEDGFVLSGRGRFIDVFSMTDEQRLAVTEWAVQEGLLELKEIVRLHMLDTETDVWSYTDLPDLASAEREAEDMDEDEFRIEEIPAHIGTEKLAVLSGHGSSGTRMGESTAFDLALIQFAGRDPSIDGVWWDEHYDPSSLSAPRGGIFPDRIDAFTACPATWEDFEEIEERFLSGDAQLEPMQP